MGNINGYVGDGVFNYTFTQQGWQCPICKRVYSPNTFMCYYCGNESHVITTQLTDGILRSYSGVLEGRRMTENEINNLKYKVCCPLCDNNECVRGTDKCDAEIWARQKAESEDNE